MKYYFYCLFTQPSEVANQKSVGSLGRALKRQELRWPVSETELRGCIKYQNKIHGVFLTVNHANMLVEPQNINIDL